MDHKNLQEAIEQLSSNQGMNSEEVKSNFNLNENDMMAMQSHSSTQKVTPRPGYCCCCFQSDN